MPTREELRSFTTHSANFTATNFTFTLINNATSTAYFAMEGARYWGGTSHKYKDVFNSSSISSLNNCTMVTGSRNAAFIIDPISTSTFVFTPTSTINKDLVLFSAPNALVYSTGDNTASGSYIGVDLTIS